jgi:conjugative transfer signal peptidase TraF
MPEPRDLPLFRWGAELRRARAARRRRNVRLACGLAGLTLLTATAVAPPAPLLVWNVSASAPRGLYAVRAHARLARGDMVVAWTPAQVRTLAAQRRYLPANVPLVKRVAAVPGDPVCAMDARMLVRGMPVALRLRHDAAGRNLPWWLGCRTLRPDEFLLLMPAAHSFDGRYFGPVRADAIVGKAMPLWVR